MEDYMKYILGVLSIMIVLTGCATSKKAKKVAQVNEIWQLDTGGEIWSSPVLNDGKLYFGNDNGSFYSVDTDKGSVIWEFKSNGIIRSTPALNKNSVFFVSDDGNLYSLDKLTGEVNWILDIGNNKRLIIPKNTESYDWDFRLSSPVVDGDYLYVGSSDSKLYKVDITTGTVVWDFKSDNIIRTAPYIIGDKVFVGTYSWSGSIYCINTKDGNEVWKYTTGGMINSDFASIDNSILIGSRDANLYALDIANGNLNWKYTFTDGSWIESSCVVKGDNIYLGSSDSMKLLSLDKNGKENWSYDTGGWSWGTPAIDGDTIYIGSMMAPSYTYFPQSKKKLFAVDSKTGEEVWSFEPESKEKGYIIGGVYTTPVIDGNTVYFGSINGKFYAIQG